MNDSFQTREKINKYCELTTYHNALWRHIILICRQQTKSFEWFSLRVNMYVKNESFHSFERIKKCRELLHIQCMNILVNLHVNTYVRMSHFKTMKDYTRISSWCHTYNAWMFRQFACKNICNNEVFHNWGEKKRITKWWHIHNDTYIMHKCPSQFTRKCICENESFYSYERINTYLELMTHIYCMNF